MSTAKKIRILSLDGGGIRGIIPATVVNYIEKYFQKTHPNTTIADHFDLIAGTSTGGILTGIYLTPDDNNKTRAKFSAEEALNFYVKEGYKIFNASKNPEWKRLWGLLNATKFNPKYLENLLEEKFKNRTIKEFLKPCLITTYNMENKNSFFFSSLENPMKRNYLIRDVLRSTSAAPTYFPPAKIKNIAPDSSKEESNNEMINIDGGVFANNPTMCAYAEARNINFRDLGINEPTAKDMQILSIGTGGGGFSLKNKEKSNNWNLLKWAKTIPEIMMDGSLDTVSYQINEIFQTLDSDCKKQYLRIDTPIEDRNYSSDMSNASKENINALIKAGNKTLEHAIKNGLNNFLDQLITEKKQIERSIKSKKQM
jgi:uncharacterized protein